MSCSDWGGFQVSAVTMFLLRPSTAVSNSFRKIHLFTWMATGSVPGGEQMQRLNVETPDSVRPAALFDGWNFGPKR